MGGKKVQGFDDYSAEYEFIQNKRDKCRRIRANPLLIAAL